MTFPALVVPPPRVARRTWRIFLGNASGGPFSNTATELRMHGAVIVVVPLESALNGALEGSRCDRLHSAKCRAPKITAATA